MDSYGDGDVGVDCDADKDGDRDLDAEERLRRWKIHLETEWSISATVGYAIGQGAANALKGFAASRAACQERFFQGLGGLYRMKESADGFSPVPNAAVPVQDWTPFYDIIRSGDPVSSAVEVALARWKCGRLGVEQVKQEACSLLSDVCELQGYPGSMLPERLDLLRQAETLEQLSVTLTGQLEEIRKSFVPLLSDKVGSGQPIAKALEYIAAHYTENLTLQHAADSVFLSKSYFSLLFKKQTGRNFIDYLIELRIREAKRLLARTDGKIYDVAGAAGFNDVKYFSKMFKKVTGLTPVEYRDKHQGTGSHPEGEER
jgi:two-component system response regulator YesN